MRQFIISDLHGNGNMYHIIINYLEKIYKEDQNIKLYINGDLIDRGPNSADMLIDVKYRIENKIDFPIEYLAGNHELMMYQASRSRKNNEWPKLSDWFLWNGGKITASGLREKLTLEEEQDMIKFIANLKVYHKFNEKIIDKNIVLVHAKCPGKVEDSCSLKIKDINFITDSYLWARKIDPDFHIKNKLGNKDYFTIIGHTSVDNKFGYLYIEEDNCLNIDGGNASYAKGHIEFDHTPLVEIDNENNRLKILTFNNNNEIIYGNYFDGENSKLMSDEELNNYRSYLKDNFRKIKINNKK